MTHILVDTANTFFRARHVIRGDTSEKVGMAIHIMMNSIKKAWQDFGGTHVVFCLEGRSFRKDIYAPYKRNRKEMADAMTEKEKEEKLKKENAYPDESYSCPICQRTLKEISRKGQKKLQSWVLDHCHHTETFRGWICGNCNTGLGAFKDSIDRVRNAVSYLQKHEEKIDE